MNEETLFHLALQQPSAERAAFLEKLCAGDDALRQRVAALLHAADNPGDFLGPPLGATVDEPRRAEGPGTCIGPYKLLQQIGEGGMGTVFMAEQTEPVRRLVALKVIKQGMDTHQVIARFEAERQALALMDHPNIAKVLGAGATEAGRPYFVMELVKGVLITKYCDEHRLTPRQRLELFVPVCQAVQHAHQKGIIHRDLKPSNVLIASYDGKPVPKVIDFGIAKATGQKLTDKTLFTDFGAVVGTLEYMSPEQAELNQLDIDTRSDLYALGVLLYELLTGTTPFERKRLRSAAMLECLRIIREEEPQKPSTRLSTAEQLASVAANRGLEPKKLTGVVRGDLDWIVMKCLEKDRNRRYETANGLALDVQRYLADEPVLASPPSLVYRLHKFARRHKAGLLTTAATLLVMALAASGVGWALWDRASQDTARRAELATHMAETERTVTPALAKAEQSVTRAGGRQRSTTSAEALAALADWREAAAAVAAAEAALTTGAATDELRERVATMRQRVEAGWTHDIRKEQLFRELDDARMALSEVVDNQFNLAGAATKYAAAFAAYDPEMTVGRSDEFLRRLGAAEPEVRDAMIVALDNWADAAALAPTAWSAKDLRDLAERADHDPWRQRYRAAVIAKDRAALRALSAEARRSSLSPSTLSLLARNLGNGGERDEALALLRWGRGRHPTDFWIHFQLGEYLLTEKGRTPVEVEEGIGCHRAALALRPEASAVHNNLGNTLLEKNQWDEAVAEFRKAIELDSKFASPHFNLGVALKAKNQWDDAITEYRKAIDLNPKFMAAHNNLGSALAVKNQWDEAIAEYRKVIDLDPTFAAAHYNLGNTLTLKNQWDDAIAEYRKAIDLDSKLARAHHSLGNALTAKNQWDEAIAEYRKAIDIESEFAPAHHNLGNALRNKNQFNEAIDEFRKAIDIYPKQAESHCYLGNALKDQGKLAAALEELRLGDELGRKKPGWSYPSAQWLRETEILFDLDGRRDALLRGETAGVKATDLLAYAMFRHDHGKLDEAVVLLQQTVALQPDLADAYGNLSWLLQEQGKLDQAAAAALKAIELNPHVGWYHSNYGVALEYQGQLEEALAEYRKAERLPNAGNAPRNLKKLEPFVALLPRLSAVRKGDAKPTDAAECLQLAQLAEKAKQWVLATRLADQAFTDKPDLADDLNSENRYNAACAASLAAAGQGKDHPSDEAKKAGLRRQALDWLRADLAAWTKLLNGGKAEDRKRVADKVRHWQEDADLIGIRDANALKQLPADEQEAWRKFWADVTELLKKAAETK